MLGLKLLLTLLIIVNQPKPSRPATSKLGLESKSANSALVSLVQGSELFVELGFADGGSGGVEDVDDELASVEETVGDELAGSDGDRAGGILSETTSRRVVSTRGKEFEVLRARRTGSNETSEWERECSSRRIMAEQGGWISAVESERNSVWSRSIYRGGAFQSSGSK